jgi:hypothetical protein
LKSALFSIIDRASPVLDRFSRQMSDFAKLVARTKIDLAALGEGKPCALTRGGIAERKAMIDRTSAIVESIFRPPASTFRSTLSSLVSLFLFQ